MSKNAQPQATVNCSFLCSLHFCDVNVRTLCRTSVLWRAAKCHCQAAEFLLHIYIKNKFKALNTLSNTTKYIITREIVVVFPCLKILLRHSNRLTLCNHHEPSCYVRSSSEGRKTVSLPLSPLCLQVSAGMHTSYCEQLRVNTHR